MADNTQGSPEHAEQLEQSLPDPNDKPLPPPPPPREATKEEIAKVNRQNEVDTSLGQPPKQAKK